jgi:hypothetical protein
MDKCFFLGYGRRQMNEVVAETGQKHHGTQVHMIQFVSWSTTPSTIRVARHGYFKATNMVYS